MSALETRQHIQSDGQGKVTCSRGSDQRTYDLNDVDELSVFLTETQFFFYVSLAYFLGTLPSDFSLAIQNRPFSDFSPNLIIIEELKKQSYTFDF